MDQSAKEPRNSKLPLSEQDKCIAELQEVSSMLLDRLDRVLTPQPESPTKESAERTVSLQSQIASELEDNNSRIRRVTSRLRNALERLEV